MRLPSTTWVLLGLCSGHLACVGLNFRHQAIHQAISPEQSKHLVPGQANLGDCLAALGAPTEVEVAKANQQWVLSWTWVNKKDWGFFLAIPSGDNSASFNWQSEKQKPHFLRLVFDSQGRLLHKLQG